MDICPFAHCVVLYPADLYHSVTPVPVPLAPSNTH
mgnify:FL=1